MTGCVVEPGITWMLILICVLLGIFGQLLRTSMGFYKLIIDPDKPFADYFRWKRLFASLALGAMVGCITSLLYKIPLSNVDMIGVISASYAGSDWLEGFLMKKSNLVP